MNATGTCCRPAVVPPSAPEMLMPALAAPAGSIVGVTAARLMVNGAEADDGWKTSSPAKAAVIW